MPTILLQTYDCLLTNHLNFTRLFIHSAMVILLNTFASPIICGLALPILLITNKRHPTHTDPDAQQSNAQDGSEIDVLENKNRSFLDLYRIAVTYLGLFMLKVCCLRV